VHTAAYAARPHGNRDAPTTSHMSLDVSKQCGEVLLQLLNPLYPHPTGGVTLTTAGPRRVLWPWQTAEAGGGICRAHTPEGERGGREAYEKAKEVVEEGRERGSMTLKGFEKRVEVGGKEHLVRVIDGDAELEESQDGKKLLRIKIMAEVDGVKSDYTITFGMYGEVNAARGRAQRQGTRGQGGRRRKTRRRDRGIDRCKAEGAPHEEWQDNDRVRQSASRRFYALRRTGGHHSEMARRDGQMNKTA